MDIFMGRVEPRDWIENNFLADAQEDLFKEFNGYGEPRWWLVSRVCIEDPLKAKRYTRM